MLICSSRMKFWFHLALHLTVAFSGYGVVGNTLCAFSKKDNVKYKRGDLALEEDIHHHSITGHAVDSNNTEHCSKDSDSCYVLWQEDPLNKSVIILTQGCWDSSGDLSCVPNECIAHKKSPKALNHTKFCCCSGNLCNLNVTDVYVSSTTDQIMDLNPALQYVEPISYSLSTIAMITIAALVIFVILSLLMYYLFKHYFNPIKRGKESLHLMESAASAPMFDFGSLKTQETIGKGRYGTVCRGILQDHTVAVKIFSLQNKQYFLNERDIYTLPYMEHPSILKYIGSEERLGLDGRPEFLLVLSFSPDGCLQDYLRKFTVNFSGFCKMSLSIARGLAHLHTEQGKGDKIKPCIAHRDLTSRNILMKADGTCMLCDFGFALRISGSKYFHNGEEQVAETTSLADVGTSRYMAPEILEGAVNLRDCESSLKQIDVYALGLVLWEIATRCTDLFPGSEVSEYKMPFEVEIGTHPTMEQMQLLVTRNKARPLFPNAWSDINPAVRTLKETIEECWDQDAEARLTTLCVEERLAELFYIWERYKDGLSAPTSLNASLSNLASSQKALCKVQSSSDMNSEALNNELLNARDKSRSLSEGTTITLLSPSEPGTKEITFEKFKKDIVDSSVSKVPVQPHQGYNPCLERNLLLESDEEVTVRGNQLIEKKNKVAVGGNYYSLSDGDAAFNDVIPVLDSTSLVYNDLLNHSVQMFNPVPHLMNVVAPTFQKKLNVPSNGDVISLEDEPTAKGSKRWLAFKFFNRKRNATGTVRSGLRNLLERKSSSTTNRDFAEEQQPLKETVGKCVSPTPNIAETHGPISDSNDVCLSDEGKSNGQLIQTEVRVVEPKSSSAVVRAINNAQVSLKEEKLETAEKTPNGIAKAITGNNNVASSSIFAIHNNVLNDASDMGKMKRPKSLPLQELSVYNDGCSENSDKDINLDESSNEFCVPMRRKNSGKKKGVKRVKTPFEIKGRFSLYDDRIMSSQELSMAYSKEAMHKAIFGDNTKFSTSVPLDMNILCSTQTNTVSDAEMQLKSGDVRFKNGLKVSNLNHMKVVNSVCDI